MGQNAVEMFNKEAVEMFNKEAVEMKAFLL